MIIPPASDMEAMAKFLEEHPRWSPVLDDNGVQIGVASPWCPLPAMYFLGLEFESGDGA